MTDKRIGIVCPNCKRQFVTRDRKAVCPECKNVFTVEGRYPREEGSKLGLDKNAKKVYL